MRKNTPSKIQEQLSQAAANAEKAEIQSGKRLDPNLVEKYEAPDYIQAKGATSTYQDLPGDYYEDFDEYINPNLIRGRNLTLDEMKQLRYENQSLGEQFGNFAGRIATNVIPQTIAGFSSMLDIPGYFDAERAANNEIVKWANRIEEGSREDMPIYTDPTGDTADLGSAAWWLDRGAGLTTSILSFLAQGAGMGKLVSLGMKGMSNALLASKLAKAVNPATIDKVVQGTGTVLNAAMLNQSEAALEASQVYSKIYDQGLGKGLSPSEAKLNAANAAATTMNLNRLNIILNLTSAKAFLSPSTITRNILEKPSTLLGKVVQESGQESLEELINLVASKAGEARGNKKNYTFSDALKDMGTMEGFEAAFLGALGGMAQTAGSHILEGTTIGQFGVDDGTGTGQKISKRAFEKQEYEKQQEIIKKLKEDGVNFTDALYDLKEQFLLFDKIHAAEAAGNTDEAEQLKEQLFENKALKAFQTGTTKVLEGLYQAEANKDPNEVGVEHIERAKKAVQDLRNLEQIYNNYEGYSNVNELFFNRASKNRLEAAEAENRRGARDLEFKLREEVDAIAKNYTAKDRREVIVKKEGEEQRKDEPVVERGLKYSLSDLENNTETSEENRATYDKFLKEVKALTTYKQLEAVKEQASVVEKAIKKNQEEFEKFISPEHQEKVAKQQQEELELKQAYDKLDNATKISEVENLAAKFTNPEFKKKADAKKAALEKQLRADTAAKNQALAAQALYTKIENLALEDAATITEEIQNAPIDKGERTKLLAKLSEKLAELSGEAPVDPLPYDPLAAFTGDPETLAKETEEDDKRVNSTLPSDFSNPSQDTSNVEAGIEDNAKSLLETDATMQVGQDERGNIIYNYVRSVEGHNLAAYLSRQFNQKEELGSVTREEITDSLENLDILNPDYLTAGTELSLEVDTTYDGDKYDAESNTRETIDWKNRLIELRKMAQAKNIPLEQLDEYIAEVPIKAVADGKTVFYVHDNGWYKQENLDASNEDIAIDKAKNFEIRKAIIQKGGKVKSKVNYKSFGKLFKTKDGKAISVSDAMPDKNLILAVGRNNALQFGTDVSTALNGGSLINTKIENGRTYAVVKVGPNNYLPIPLNREKLSQKHIDSIVFAIKAHLSQDDNNPVVKAVKEQGIDLTDLAGLREYINQFTYLFPTEGMEGLENILLTADSKGGVLKAGTFLLSVTATGIEFGKVGIATNHSPGAKSSYINTISSNFGKSARQNAINEQLIIKLASFLENAVSHASNVTLQKDGNAVVILDKNGDTETLKYTELVKQTHKTNILSVNVGTEDKPIWAYTIQPRILFDTAFVDLSKVKPAKVAQPKVTTTPTNPVPPITNPLTTEEEEGEVASSNIDAQKADIERTRQEELIETPRAYSDPTMGYTIQYLVENGIIEGPIVKPGTSTYLRIKEGIDKLNAEINAKYDRKYIDAVKKGEMTKEQAMKALEDIGRKDSVAYAELAALEGTTADKKAEIEARYNKIIEEEGLNILAPITYDERGLSSQEIQEARKKQAEQLERDKRRAELNKEKQKELAALEGQPATQVIKKKRVKLENMISDFSEDAQALLNNPNPTIEEYEAVISNYEFDLSADISDTLRADIESQLEDIKNTFEIAPAQATTTSSETQVESQITEEEAIEALAQDLLKLEGIDVASLTGLLTNIADQLINEQQLIEQGFASKEQAVAIFKKAIEILNKPRTGPSQITLPDGTVIDLEGLEDISEDETDDLISELSEEEVDTIKSEIDDLIIKGVDPATQYSLISYISSGIIERALQAKVTDGKQTVSTLPIFEQYKQNLMQLAQAYKQNNMPNRAKKVQAVLDQYDKVISLVNQQMSRITVGTVKEDFDLTDSEEAVGLEKLVYSDDWSFTINSKSTASADLRKFFVGLKDLDENGKPFTNALGLPEILPFDEVYDTLHEMLANRPSDFNKMIEALSLYKKAYPWVESVIQKLQKAPENIKNEFVSDMTKHHINMQFIMWSRDKYGNYSLQKWSSNSSSIEQRLRASWSSNLKGVATRSNLVTVNEDDEYIFDKNVVKSLDEQFARFAADPNAVSNDDMANWLGQFGIVISDETYNDLRAGKYSNQGKKSWTDLFTNDAGLFNVLMRQLRSKQNLKVEDSELLNDSAIKALAKLDALNTNNVYSNSFQAGGKTIYSYGNNNYLINRMRDLLAYDPTKKQFVNQQLIDDLKKISFTKDSIWLNELTSDQKIGDATRNKITLSYLSLEALKKKYTKSQDNRKLNNLTAAEHEVTKLGFFQNKSGEVIDKEDRRTVDFFYLTMSDKTTMLTIQALSRELVLEDGNISRKNLELLYQAAVLPEINRMRDKQASNIAGYEPNYFYFIPALNEATVTINDVEYNLRDLALDKDSNIFTREAKEAILDTLESTFNDLVTKKLEDWNKLGIGKTITDEKGRVIDKYTFMDKEYMSKVAKTGKDTDKVKYAAMDYVFNYMIANAEMQKLFVGDPALYAKFKADKTLQENLAETFTNLGKRLAGDIAPGIELANSEHNQYYQVFLNDQKINSSNVEDTVQKEFFSKVISKFVSNYSGIEGSDAQEYTTWQEHLYVLRQLGRITDAQYEKFKTKLSEQSKGNIKPSTKLSYEELGLIMQPMKPVYVGNITDTENNVDRRMYIKSSSFPLIPELTSTLEIDKVRKALEAFEESVSTESADGTPTFVRASFGTANKVGAIKNGVKVFNADGSVVDNFSVTKDNALKLERKNFRIQQDVPYKRDKSEVNQGTQEAKLLFADFLDIKIDGETTGAELLAEYLANYEELYEYGQEKLARRLGLVSTQTVESRMEELLTNTAGETFAEVAKLEEELKGLSAIKKVTKQQEFAEKMGENTLERVNFINKNFDAIVKQMIKAKINLFVDDNGDFKNCD